MKISASGLSGTLAAGLAILLSSAAGADVKAGVDAWSAGDYAAAIKEWRQPAEQGDPDAQFNLAQAYRMGLGVERDLAMAEELYGKAAARGHLQAADNYGVLLFQRGERQKAMPFIEAGAYRGDARAQYILGLAHFNGDLAPKDWVRAYALASLAHQAGLQQAADALSQMDQHIPLEQRQQSVLLAADMAAKAEAYRNSQIAAANLGTGPVATNGPAPSAVPTAKGASLAAASPASAGADYTRPTKPRGGVPQIAQMLDSATAEQKSRPAPEPKKVTLPEPAPVAKPGPPKATAGNAPKAGQGQWRVQLGAFGVPGNAERLWQKVSKRPELAGHEKLLVPAGRLTKLQAGGFSRASANTACARLKSAGFACLPVTD